jgi:phosphatidylglycerophosphatase A
MQNVTLWLAQGCGLGRIRQAPGTFGSLGGLLWFLILLKPGSLWGFSLGVLLGLILSVWVCGRAEKILQQRDPSSVVLDEIAAMPLCFLPSVLSHWFQAKALPAPESFFTGRAWIGTILIFALFRLFDIAKPWPIRQSQGLPGGWGVTVDDFLAAVCVALLTLVFGYGPWFDFGG